MAATANRQNTCNSDKFEDPLPKTRAFVVFAPLKPKLIEPTCHDLSQTPNSPMAPVKDKSPGKRQKEVIENHTYVSTQDQKTW